LLWEGDFWAGARSVSAQNEIYVYLNGLKGGDMAFNTARCINTTWFYAIRPDPSRHDVGSTRLGETLPPS